jgi:hypothetical protein
MKIQIEGLDKLHEVLKGIQIQAKEAVVTEFAWIVLDLEGEAKRRAPKDTGDLRGSGYSEVVGMEGTVGFTAPYALRQHEHVEFRHTDGEAKFLETPFKEKQKMYIKAVGDAVKRQIGG